MLSSEFNKIIKSVIGTTAVIVLFFMALSAQGAYVVHSVSGNVTLVSNGKSVPLKKGMTVTPSDMIDIPDKGKLEIFNDLDSKIYTSVNTGRLSVMRIMLDAKQKASDNSANVHGFVSVGKSGGETDGRVYMEKGMVKRRLAFFEEDSARNYKDSQTPSSLASTLNELVATVPGSVGIAFVSKNDTITINNGVRYPLMSVFKLHQALAVADKLEQSAATLDSALYIPAFDMDKNTWSPMLSEYGNEDFMISVGELLKYSLSASDNNASNLLFKRIVSPIETDKFVKSIAADTTFRIAYSESVMKNDHDLSYTNYSSPLSAALLINQVFTKDLVSKANQDSIKAYLTEVTTGHDRLGAAIEGENGVLFGHKTGSGYRNNHGELIAHNDVGYFRLPDGRDYSLAVFIRDFNGSEEDASAIIANISRRIYAFFKNN